MSLQIQLAAVEFEKAQAATPRHPAYLYYCFNTATDPDSLTQVCYQIESVDYSSQNRTAGTATHIHVRDEHGTHFTVPHLSDDNDSDDQYQYTRVDPMSDETHAFYGRSFVAHENLNKQQEQMKQMQEQIRKQQQENTHLQQQPNNNDPHHTHQGPPGQQKTTTMTTTTQLSLTEETAADPDLWLQLITNSYEASEGLRLLQMRFTTSLNNPRSSGHHEVSRNINSLRHLLQLKVALHHLDGNAAEAALRDVAIAILAGPEFHRTLHLGTSPYFANAMVDAIAHLHEPQYLKKAREVAAAETKAAVLAPRILSARGGGGGGGWGDRGRGRGGGRGGWRGGRGGGGGGGLNYYQQNQLKDLLNSNNNNNNPGGGKK
jgi:hypothetical protein